MGFGAPPWIALSIAFWSLLALHALVGLRRIVLGAKQHPNHRPGSTYRKPKASESFSGEFYFWQNPRDKFESILLPVMRIMNYSVFIGGIFLLMMAVD